jgi:hypothetical protein
MGVQHDQVFERVQKPADVHICICINPMYGCLSTTSERGWCWDMCRCVYQGGADAACHGRCLSRSCTVAACILSFSLCR